MDTLPAYDMLQCFRLFAQHRRHHDYRLLCPPPSLLVQSLSLVNTLLIRLHTSTEPGTYAIDGDFLEASSSNRRPFRRYSLLG